MSAPLLFAVARSNRDQRAKQKEACTKFSQQLRSTLNHWRMVHPATAPVRQTQALECAILVCQSGCPLSERQLKAARDEMLALCATENNPELVEKWEQCLSLLVHDGKKIMGYGKIETLSR
ncbi:MAG: hypothetical protein K2Q12_07545 [Rickettsiales bacterium]|nr:hypothetical protein [Rickettsiales bacterium]